MAGARFIEEARGDDPEAAATLRIEERGLDATLPSQNDRYGDHAGFSFLVPFGSFVRLVKFRPAALMT